MIEEENLLIIPPSIQPNLADGLQSEQLLARGNLATGTKNYCFGKTSIV